MEGKKKYVAIVLFLLIGLSIFTFANPGEEEQKGEVNGGSKEVDKDKTVGDDEVVTPEESDEDTTTNKTSTNSNRTTGTSNTKTPAKEDNSYKLALEAVEKAESSLTTQDSLNARNLVAKVTDETKKEKLSSRLDAVDEAINATKLVEELERLVKEATNKQDLNNAKNYRDNNDIANVIAKLTIEEVKEDLTKRLEEVNKILEDETAPVITLDGVKDGETTNKTVTATVDDENATIKVTLNGTDISGTLTFTEEGTYVITAMDTAFNESSVSFTIDKTPAVKNAVNANVIGYKNEVKEQYAINGKTIAAYISINEELKYNPTFIFYSNGKEIAKISKDDVVASKSSNENFPYVYTARLEINESLIAEDGKITFKVVDIYDKGGNQTEDITEMSVKDKIIILDRTPNRVTQSFIRNVSGVEIGKTYYLKNGTSVQFSIGFSEKLGTNATITIGGKNIELTYEKYYEATKSHMYYGYLEIAEDEKDLQEGLLEITIANITDEAGNTGFYYQTNGKTVLETITKTETTNGKKVIYDRTPASRVYSTLRVNKTEYIENGTKYYYVKNGESFEFAISFNEELAKAPTVTIAGREVEMKLNEKVKKNENKYLYEGTFKIDSNEKELKQGLLEIKVSDIKDIAGNETTLADQTKTSNGRSVIYDCKNPVITGVNNKYFYNRPVIIDEVKSAIHNVSPIATATIDGETYELGTEYAKEGTHEFIAYDRAGNRVRVTFTIDLTAPSVTGIDENKPTNKNEIVYVSDKNLISVTIDGTEYTKDDFTVENDTIKFQKKITHEGTHTVTAVDEAGNVTTKTFVIDKTAPVYSSLRVIGGNLYNEDGKFVRYAKNGTTIYVYTTFTEKLAVAPTVTMNGTVAITSYLAKAQDGNYIYASAFKLNETDGLKDGPVSIKVEGYADAAGNVGVTLTDEDITLASQKYVVIDKTPVKVTLSGGTLGDNPYRNINVKLYDANIVTSVEINGTKLSHTGKYVDINDGHAYTFQEGENTIVAKDKAGNVTTVTYIKDTKAPVAKSFAISGGNLVKENGKVNWYVTNGGYIYVNLQFAEKLAVTPKVVLNETVEAKLRTVKESGDVIIYSYSHKVNENDGLKNGLVTVEVSGYADAAGNVGATLTNEDITLASQKYVIVDKTPVKITIKDSSIGNGEYSKLDVKLYDANKVSSVEINGTKLPHTGKYVDINDGHAYTFQEGENTIVAKDYAGNVTTVTYIKDVTAPEIQLVGTAGLNANELRVEAGTKVSVKDVMATATDNYDKDVLVEIIKADFLATKEHPERNVYNYDFSNGFDTTTVGRYNITYKATDNAENSSTKTMLLVISDTTAPEIILKGTAGKNKNELRVDQDEVVTLEDVTATSKDIVDGEKTLYPVKITRFYPSETGKASHSYDASNGFDTSIPGRYNIKYEVTDEAGNYATKTMLLVIKVTKTPEVVNGKANLYGDLTLIDEPFYNVKENSSPVVINGNGYSVTQKVTSGDKFNWTENGTRTTMGNIFSSINGSTITVKNIKFKGTVQTFMLGHYKNSTYNNYNTILNNVDIIGVKVVSFSGNIAPAVAVYGNATINNSNIYGTKRSELETSPNWPIYDLAVVNYTSTEVNNSKIGSVFTWAKAYMEFNNSDVDTIITSCRSVSDFTKGKLVIGNGTTVDKIIVNNKNARITIKSGAVVETLDYNNLDDTNMTIVIEDGATVKNIINKVVSE